MLSASDGQRATCRHADNIASRSKTSMYPTSSDTRTDIFEYIEVWYNRQRCHSTLGYLSPGAFEATYSLDNV